MGSEGTIQGKLHGTLKSNDILIENESNDKSINFCHLDNSN
jgi:hypothetical protein